MQKKMSKGIIIFSILICLLSLWDFKTNISFSRYYHLLQPLSEKLILLRYVFSLSLRIVLFISGIGVLFLKDIFRKIILFISFFTIATIYWKHPMICFRNVVDSLSAQGAFTPDVPLTPNALIWILFAINYAIDIGFSLCLIYYFTRPRVKEQFK